MKRFKIIGILLGTAYWVLDAMVSQNTPATPAELALRCLVFGVFIWAGFCASKTFACSKETDENLQTSYTLLKAIMEGTTDAIFVKDREGRYLTCNTACATFLGKTVQEVSGKDDFKLFPPESAAIIHEVDQSAITEGKANSYEEVLMVAGHDEPRTFLSIKAPFRDGNGDVIGLIGIARDITDRKKAENDLKEAHELLDRRVEERTRELASANAALRDSERQIRLMADALPALIAYLDKDARYKFANHAYKRFLDLPANESLVGRKAIDVLGKKAYETLRPLAEKVLQGKEVYHRTEIHLPNGETRLVEGCYVPNNNAEGEVLGFYVLVFDVTEQAKNEDLIRQQRQELAHVARVNTMGELTASLAHELKQPLTAILCNAQAAQRFIERETPDKQEIESLLNDIVNDNKRAADIIHKLRALSTKGEVVQEDIDLTTLIDDVVKLVNSDVVIRGVTIQIEKPDTLPTIKGDRVQLQQVLLNLILNGCEAMKEVEAADRKIVVRAAVQNGSKVEVSVVDAGHGLSEKDLERAFDPFFTTKKAGIGMGLSINRGIIEAHHGRLYGSNNKDQGATFGFTLPISG